MKLAHASDEAGEIDNVSLSLAQIWKGKLAGGKNTDQIQIQQDLKVLN